MDKTNKQTNILLSEPERRALQMLAGALGLSVAGWTREMLKEKWQEKFPDMDFPDTNGNIKHKTGVKR